MDRERRQRVVAIELTAVDQAGPAKGVLARPFGLELRKGARLHDRPRLRSQDVRSPAQGGTLKVILVADGGKDIRLTIPLKGFVSALDRVGALTK